MTPSKPICIASKGRAGQSKTIAALLAEGTFFHLFVEPQEFNLYLEALTSMNAAHPMSFTIHDIGENNRGISYVRQFILDCARKSGWDWFWMMDDDVNQCYEVIRGRCTKMKIGECLGHAEKHITREKNVALGSLEYQQFAWSAKKPLKFNSYCDVVVLINVERTRFIHYREHLGGKEDRDFVLQALAIGYQSMRTSWLAFSAPKNGSNAGGLQDFYQTDREAECSRRMVEAWPGVCRLHTKANGRPDVKIDWKQFKIETLDE